MRAEAPKAPEEARPERAEAPSPGHRPEYNSNQQGALLGQKNYYLPGVFKILALLGDKGGSSNTSGGGPGRDASRMPATGAALCPVHSPRSGAAQGVSGRPGATAGRRSYPRREEISPGH